MQSQSNIEDIPLRVALDEHNDLRAATDAFFSVRLQRVVELSPTAAQVWSFNQDLWEGKNKIIREGK